MTRTTVSRPHGRRARTRLAPACRIAFAMALFALSLPAAPRARAQQAPRPAAPPAPREFKLGPRAEIQRGGDKEAQFFITAEDGSELTDHEVEAFGGHGIEVEDSALSADNKTLTFKVLLAETVEAGVFELKVLKDGAVVGLVPLTVAEEKPLPPQPIPPGSTRGVDAQWIVQPDKVTRDNFGRRIADQFYAVEVIIGNNSGYDLQLAGVGFEALLDCPNGDCSNAARFTVPTTSRRMVRQTVVKEKDFGRRALALNLIEGIGNLTSGFIPFFKVANTKANYSTLTSIFGNQFKEGFKFAVPDLTVAQLGRLDEEIVRDGLTVQHNRSERAVVFVPKEVLTHAFRTPEDAKNIGKVMVVLGDLVISGKFIKTFENRMVVVRRPTTRPDAEEPARGFVGNTTDAIDLQSVPVGAGVPEPAAPSHPVVNALVYVSAEGTPTGPPMTDETADQEVRIRLEGQNLGAVGLKFAAQASNNFNLVGSPVSTPTSVEAVVRVRKGTKPGIYRLLATDGDTQLPFDFEVVERP